MNVGILQSDKLKEHRDFFTFFLTALFGASVNFFSQIFYRDYYDFDTSVLLGYLTAMIVSFLPTKLYAFAAKGTGSTGREAIKYVVTSLIAWGVQVWVAVSTLDWIATPLFPTLDIFYREKGSHVVGMGVSFLINYFGNKLLTFRSTGVYNRMRSRRPD